MIDGIDAVEEGAAGPRSGVIAQGRRVRPSTIQKLLVVDEESELLDQNISHRKLIAPSFDRMSGCGCKEERKMREKEPCTDLVQEQP